jgi:HD-like signal output (HDOD) protein
MPPQTPRTLQAWIKLLNSIRLPVPRLAHERVSSAINDSNRSMREISERMQDSPALVLSVIREANMAVSNELVEPAESLEIAINRLGLKRTGELLRSLPALDPTELPVALRQLQMISLHASQQASGLFAARLARLWQEIHWGSLLFLSPLWPLAISHPKLLEEWELRVIHKNEPVAKVELELFGIRLLELCQAMAELWRLPQWIIQGYRLLQNERRQLVRVMHIARHRELGLQQQQELDSDPELRRWLNQPANTVLLANGLALSAQQAWDTPHNTRWQYLTCLYLQMPLGDLQQQVHQQAVLSAQNHAGPGIWHPATALLWPWDQRRVHKGMVAAPAPSAHDLKRWSKFCTELLAEPSRFNNAMELTHWARDALVASGMSRIMMLMTDKTMSQLRVHQIVGLPEPSAQLTLNIDHSTLLQHLTRQAGQIRITLENHDQYWSKLPASLRTLFRGDNLLARSLVSNGRVVMIVLADQGGGPFSEITVQAFGKTAQCIERALTTFSNRSR